MTSIEIPKDLTLDPISSSIISQAVLETELTKQQINKGLDIKQALDNFHQKITKLLENTDLKEEFRLILYKVFEYYKTIIEEHSKTKKSL